MALSTYASRLIINIKDLLAVHRVEKQRVEFKRSWNTGATSWQILRTICAFGNDYMNDDGGYIIIGVEDEPSEDGQLQVIGIPEWNLDKIHKQLVGLCKGNIRPEYHPVLSPEIYENKHVFVIWVTASENGPHQCRESAKGEFQYYIRRGTETIKASPEERSELLRMQNKIPFDDRMAVDSERGNQLTEKDISSSLVKEFLRDIGSNIRDQDLHDPRQLYENMRLVRSFGDKQQEGRLVKCLVPRNVALLFFSNDPNKYFQGAKTIINVYDRNKVFLYDETYVTPIDQQVNSTLDYILRETKDKEEESLAHVLYPRKALREAVVNAFYHRGYQPEHQDPVKVNIYPTHIDIISYPGPHPSLKHEHFKEDSDMPPVKTRNRRVGEFLVKRKLAEEKGTGIRTIFRSMKDNGNIKPDFKFDETYFQVRLPGHPKFMVREILKTVNNLCARGAKQKAVEMLLGFLKGNPQIRHNSLLFKLMELHDHDKNHPNVQPYKEHFSERLERRLTLSLALQEWSKSSSLAALNIEAGAEIIRELVKEDADADDLQIAKQIAVAFFQEKCENSPEGKERALDNYRKAHQLFDAMGKVIKTDAYLSFQFACCKFNLFMKNTAKKSPRERKELSSSLTEAEVCVNDAVQLTSEENTKHLANQYRQLGYIHSQLLGMKKSTHKDVIDNLDKARFYNPEIRFNELLVHQDCRSRYKQTRSPDE